MKDMIELKQKWKKDLLIRIKGKEKTKGYFSV